MKKIRVAPYQILLHDGRLIYAPQDSDQVIRLREPAKPGDPPSPEFKLPEGADEGFQFCFKYCNLRFLLN